MQGLSLAEQLREVTHAARAHPHLVKQAALDRKTYGRENDLEAWEDKLDSLGGITTGHPGRKDEKGHHHHSEVFKEVEPILLQACNEGKSTLLLSFEQAMKRFDIFKTLQSADNATATATDKNLKEKLERKGYNSKGEVLEMNADDTVDVQWLPDDPDAVETVERHQVRIEKKNDHLKHQPALVQPDLNDEQMRGLCFLLKEGLPETWSYSEKVMPKNTMLLGSSSGHMTGADLSELAPLHANDVLSSNKSRQATDLSELPGFLAGMTKHSLAGLIWPRLIRELTHHGIRAEISTENTTHLSTAFRNSEMGVSSALLLSWEDKPPFLKYHRIPAHLTGEHAKEWQTWAKERSEKWLGKKLLGYRLQSGVKKFYNKRRDKQLRDVKEWQAKKSKMIDSLLENSARACADCARLQLDECTVHLEELLGDDPLLASLRHTILRPNTYSVIKDCDLSTELSANSKSVRKLKSKWVVDLLEEEQVDPISNCKRIKIKVRFDGSIGWATLTGEYGSVFMVPHTYIVVKEASLTNTFSSLSDKNVIQDYQTLRKVKPGEILEVLELQKRDQANNISRIHCRAKNDNQVGWVTVASNPNVCERVCPGDVQDKALRGFIYAQLDKHCVQGHELRMLEPSAVPHDWDEVCGSCGEEIVGELKADNIWTCGGHHDDVSKWQSFTSRRDTLNKCRYYECNKCYEDPFKVALQDPHRTVKVPEPHVLGNKVLPELLDDLQKERVLADILYRPPPAMCQLRLRWGNIAKNKLAYLDEESESEP